MRPFIDCKKQAYKLSITVNMQGINSSQLTAKDKVRCFSCRLQIEDGQWIYFFPSNNQICLCLDCKSYRRYLFECQKNIAIRKTKSLSTYYSIITRIGSQKLTQQKSQFIEKFELQGKKKQENILQNWPKAPSWRMEQVSE